MKAYCEKTSDAIMAFLYFTERFAIAVGWMRSMRNVPLPLAVLVVTSFLKCTRGFEFHAWRVRVGFCIPIRWKPNNGSVTWSFPKLENRRIEK